MHEVISVILTIISEAVRAFGHWVHNNLRNFANVLGVVCPYVTAWAVLQTYQDRGYVAVGGEWFLPLAFWFVMYLLRAIANKTGKGYTIPTPRKRFTQTSEDGEVTVSTQRIEELLLYMCDLEDWLERKGLMK